MLRLSAAIVASVFLPFVISMLAAHIDRESGRLARTLVALAVRLLPIAEREDFCDEWLDHISSAGEAGMLPLTRAASIALVAAPSLAVGLRVGRRRRRSAGR